MFAMTSRFPTFLIASALTLGLAACGEDDGQTDGSRSEITSSTQSSLSTEPVTHGEQPGAPESFSLSNGMQVVVLPDHRTPVVTHMVWYRVGSADEPPGKSGIAHFLEHLMFQGTETIPPGEFSQIIARNGGQDNAFTYLDYTGYFQRVALDRLPVVMEMEADRMSNLRLSDAEVLPERDVVLEERSMRIDNDPSSLLTEQMYAALFPPHSYGTPVIGWENEIAALTTADAQAHYDRFYTPNNAILVVAGDVTAETLRPLAEQYYGSIARRAEPPARERDLLGEGAGEGPKRVTVSDARVRQPILQRYYRVPNIVNAPGNDGAALDIMASLLGGLSTSHMDKTLVVGSRVAAAAGAVYSGSVLGDGRLILFAVPNGGQSPEEVEAALDAEVAAFIEQGVTQEDVDKAVNLQIAGLTYARDNQASMAQTYGVALTTGGTIEDVIAWPDRLREVTPEDVQRVAREYLNMDRSVTGILLPEEGA